MRDVVPVAPSVSLLQKGNLVFTANAVEEASSCVLRVLVLTVVLAGNCLSLRSEAFISYAAEAQGTSDAYAVPVAPVRHVQRTKAGTPAPGARSVLEVPVDATTVDSDSTNARKR